MNLFPHADETIQGVAAALCDGRLTCVEVVSRCLEAIDAREAHVRAWVSVDREGALRRAAELDADLAAGRRHGALHGIPVGIKDIVDVAGWPTAAGSRSLAQAVAERDAPIVARLRAAGAVILGKTVTTQFASFDPPVTRNPWNLERTPGGSSSGSAAAVACGMCLGAVGSQTGGSITRPASYCGVAGCKPTYGVVDVEGIVPLAKSLDHPGPIARTVGDLALMLDAMLVQRRLADAGGMETAPRIGRLRGLFEERADDAMRAAMECAIQTLSAAGGKVAEVGLPPLFDDVLRCHRVVMAVEAAAHHERRLAEQPDEYLPRIRSLIEEGLATPAPEYVRCRNHQGWLKREMASLFDGIDFLICPATTGAAPNASTTGDPAFNSPWSYTGFPTISFPIALSPDGLPLAIQLVGFPMKDAELFRAALWCERVLCRR